MTDADTGSAPRQLRYLIELHIEGIEYRNPEARRLLMRELLSPSPSGTDALDWVEPPAWDDDGAILSVSCVAEGTSFKPLRDQALQELAAAVNRVTPGRDRPIRVRRAGVVVPPRVSEHSYRERWGWYAVALQLKARAVAEDPEAASYVDREVRKWQRFREASFAFEESSAIGLFRVNVVARSAANADGEARDALENLVHAAIKDPGDYEISTSRLEWLAEPDEVPPPSRDA